MSGFGAITPWLSDATGDMGTPIALPGLHALDQLLSHPLLGSRRVLGVCGAGGASSSLENEISPGSSLVFPFANGAEHSSATHLRKRKLSDDVVVIGHRDSYSGGVSGPVGSLEVQTRTISHDTSGGPPLPPGLDRDPTGTDDPGPPDGEDDDDGEDQEDDDDNDHGDAYDDEIVEVVGHAHHHGSFGGGHTGGGGAGTTWDADTDNSGGGDPFGNEIVEVHGHHHGWGWGGDGGSTWFPTGKNYRCPYVCKREGPVPPCGGREFLTGIGKTIPDACKDAFHKCANWGSIPPCKADHGQCIKWQCVRR